VQKSTWLETYPNKSLGITKEDIEKKTSEIFKKEEVEKLKKKIKQDPSAYILVAKDRKKMVGYIGVAKGDTMNIIGGLHVMPDYQGKGIGRGLMKKGMKWLGDEKRVSLHVIAYNKRAIEFYTSYGFVENGPVTDHPIILDKGSILPTIEMIKDPHHLAFSKK